MNTNPNNTKSLDQNLSDVAAPKRRSRALYALGSLLALGVAAFGGVPAPASSPADLDGDGIPNADDLCDGRQHGRQIVQGVAADATLPRRTHAGTGVLVSTILEDEFAPMLDTITGQSEGAFSVVMPEELDEGCYSEATGIFFTTADAPLVASLAPQAVKREAALLRSQSAAAYFVHSAPEGGVWLVGNSLSSAEYAMVDWLEQLGARFFAPTENWTILPSRVDLRLPSSEIEIRVPHFDRVSFMASGGPGTHDFDGPNAIFDRPTYFRPFDQWMRWKSRLRLPATYNAMCGHSWTTFTHQQSSSDSSALTADPLYFGDCSQVACNSNHRSQVGCPPCGPNGERNTGRQTMTEYGRTKSDSALKLNPVHHGTISCTISEARVSHEEDRGCQSDADCGKGTCDASTGVCQWCEHPNDYQSFKGMVGMFTDWQVTKWIPHLLKLDPSYRYTNVDPSDSDGHGYGWKGLALLRNGPYGQLPAAACQSDADCPSDSCDTVGGICDASVSDQVFHLANMSAQRVRQHYPDMGACLLAYNEHALPPTIPLEDNIGVIIARGFHRYYTGRTNQELLNAWKAKKAETGGALMLGTYSYHNYPSLVTLNEPTLPRAQITAEMREFDGLNIVDTETTSSIGAMATQQYLLSRLVWQPEADPNAIMDDFYQKAFGPAAPAMRQLFERWEAGFQLHELELASAYRDLKSATDLLANESDPGYLARVRDYVVYVHYLRLLAEFKTAGSTEARGVLMDDLLRHIWKIYPTMMVQSYRLHDFIEEAVPPQDKARWSVANASLPVWRDVAPYSVSEIDQMLTDGLSTFKGIAGFSGRSFSNDDLVPLIADADARASGGGAVLSQVYASSADYYLHAPGDRDVSFVAQTVCPPSVDISAPWNRISLYDSEGRQIHDQALPHCDPETRSAVQTSIDLGPLAEGLYRVRLEIFYPGISTVRFLVPRDLAFGTEAPPNAALANQHNYFYVPQGTEQLVAYCSAEGISGIGTCPRAPRFYGPGDSNPVTAESLGGSIFIVDVGERDGQVWSWNNTYTRVYFLNVPSVYSPTAEQVLVPSELLAPLESSWNRSQSKVYATMAPGETRLFTFAMENTGRLDWNADGTVMLYSRSAPVNKFGQVQQAVSQLTVAGQTASFSFRVRAPMAPGHYQLSYQMLQWNEGFFGEPVSLELTVDSSATAMFDASWDQTPGGQYSPQGSDSGTLTMAPGETQNVTFVMKNTGLEEWAARSVALYSRSAPVNKFGQVLSYAPRQIGPGETESFTIGIRAPQKPGEYVASYRMLKLGQAFFGEIASVNLKVVAP